MSMATTTATATAGTIERDLTCGGCDYNLRGLPRSGACPECGHDVAATLQGFSRRRAAWLRRVSWGSLLIGVGLLMGGVHAATIAMPGGRWRGWWLLFPGGAIVAAIGTWIFAGTAPRGNWWNDRWLSIGLRVLGSGLCLMQLYIVVALAQSMNFMPLLMPYPRNFTRLCEATAGVWALTAALTYARAMMLAYRLADWPGRLQAALLAILAMGALAWGALYWNSFDRFARIAYLVAIAVVSGWSIVFFVGFSFVLRRRAT